MKRALLFEFLLVILYGCSKDSGNAGTGASLKVKSVTEELAGPTYHRVTTSMLSYDPQDRLISLQSDSITTSLTYGPGLIEKNVYHIGLPEEHSFFYVRPDGVVDSSVLYSVIFDSIYFSYQYNSKNQLEMETMRSNVWPASSYDTIYYEYNSAGDFSKTTQAGNVNTFEYYDQPNYRTPLSILIPWFPVTPHLLKQSWYAFNGVNQTTTTCAYDFDDYGRIISVSNQTTGSYPQAYKITYTYY